MQRGEFDGYQVIHLNRKRINHRYIYRTLKRIGDFIFSLLGLIFFSPLFLVVAVRIKLEDHGTVFYKQKRLGRGGKVFYMYKFRSMCMDAEKRLAELKKYNDVEGAMFKMKHDPRVTSIGHLIRKTSIDELPQLFNVLLGHMSLVGPRPPLPNEVAQYSEYDKQRLYVIPGCTGLWQVSGRNEVGFSEMVALDLKYIQKSSILFDLAIILRTIKIMIRPNGAH